MRHCTHWDEGDGDCCLCGQPNWCPDEGTTDEALDNYDRLCDECRGEENASSLSATGAEDGNQD